MIVKCINTEWKIRSLKTLLAAVFRPRIKIPEFDKEYYVIGYVELKNETYYQLDGFPEDNVFNSKHFTISSDTNIHMEEEIQQALNSIKNE